jgi:hypothetical protein
VGFDVERNLRPAAPSAIRLLIVFATEVVPTAFSNFPATAWGEGQEVKVSAAAHDPYPFDETYWVSCLRETLTSSSYGDHANSLLITWLLTNMAFTIERLYRLRYLHRGKHPVRTAADFVYRFWLTLSQPVSTDTSRFQILCASPHWLSLLLQPRFPPRAFRPRDPVARK